MRYRRCTLALALALVAVQAAPAAAHVVHTVEPGETLWSIAAASNFTTRALAAANGLSEDAQVVAGTNIKIPSEAEAAAALAGGVPGSGGAPVALGAYRVQWATRSAASPREAAWPPSRSPG